MLGIKVIIALNLIVSKLKGYTIDSIALFENVFPVASIGYAGILTA